MAEQRVERNLSPILAADVARYSRLIGEDEAGTRARFNALFNELIELTISNLHQRKAGDFEEMIGRYRLLRCRTPRKPAQHYCDRIKRMVEIKA